MRTIRMLLVAGSLVALPLTVALQPQSLIKCGPAIALAAPEDAPAQPAQPAAPAAPNVDVRIERGGEKQVVWFANPVVLAAGVIAGMFVVALIAMAARGGGTTVIRER